MQTTSETPMTAVALLRRSRPTLAGAVALLLAGACGDHGQSPLDEGQGPSGADQASPSIELLSELVVSNPLAPGSAADAGLSFSGFESSEDVVFVSLPPGSVPSGETAVVQTRGTQALATAAMADGGFDPIPVAASAGDTLDIRVQLAGGGGLLAFYAIVPPSIPPVIVRTDPPPMKHDVPLNAFMRVVFSEPIDVSTLTASSVHLLLDGEPVAGTLQFADGMNLMATFTPAELLAPEADYSLLITREIEDLDGEALSEEYRADFRTESGSAALSAAAIAFVSNRDGANHIWVANADGSGVTRVSDGTSPAWSPDGRKLAFVRGESRAGPAGIYVLDRDGSGPRFVGPGRAPTWSPDGRISFIGGYPSGVFALYVMNADGTEVTELLDAFTVLTDWGVPGTWLPNYHISNPTWSPDGRRIWFRAGTYGSRGALEGSAAADGSDARELEALTRLGPRSRPAWSPDGSRIAVTTYPGSWQEWCDGWLGVCWPGPGLGTSSVIYTYGVNSDLALSDPQVIYTDSAFLASSLDWSPDGSQMVFTGDFSPQDALKGSRIFTVSLETGAVRQLIPDATDPVRADYSDGDVVWSRGER